MYQIPKRRRAGRQWNGRFVNASHFTAPRPDAHQLKVAIDPGAFYRTELPDMPAPKRGGWVSGGLCPFHHDQHEGSFRVHLESGAFCCFSCGTKGHDVISFLMERDGLSFPETLKRLAAEWGV
jgi:hypothetical protein